MKLSKISPEDGLPTLGVDGQNITGTESNSLRTPSARYSKDDAIEFAKEAIDALPDA